jgi:hypothetical protein
MWRINFTIPHNFAAYIFRLYFAAYVLPHTFAAYICHIHFPPTFAAYICRIHFPPTFAAYTFAYILSKRQYFRQVPIFNDFCNKFLLDFVAANICVYFQYLFLQFCVRQYFWRNYFEA